MNRIVSVLLIALILTSACKDLFIYSLFKANQDYIAEKLCINIDQPTELCYGSCYLQSVVEEEHEKQDNPAFPNIEDKQIQWVAPNFSIADTQLDNPLTQKILLPENHYSIQIVIGIFHPPRMA